jgi:hypothetical protein
MTPNDSFAHADAPRRHGAPAYPAYDLAPLSAEAMERLTAWFAGDIALKRSEAHRLLERAVDSGQMACHRAEFVAAIKALAAGPTNWHDMGYRLLPDD